MAIADSPIIHITDESALPDGWRERELLRVTVLDAQRSDAILLQCGGEAMLVDGGLGGCYPRLEQLLARNGVQAVKYLWSTHCDGDHSQGLTKLMNSARYPAATLLCPNPKHYDDPDGDHQMMVSAAGRQGWQYRQITTGEAFTLGGATITSLQCMEPWGQNNRSATCFVDFGSSTLYLAADIGSRAQRLFAATVDPERFRCDILKAPHHGIDGVVQEFVCALAPAAVVITNCTGDTPGSSPSPEWNAWAPYLSGDGTVVMETDGQAWYIWQENNWRP